MRLAPARRRNALRGWLGLQLSRSSPESLLQRLMEELPACRVGHWQAPGIDLRLYRRELRASPRLDSPPTRAGETAWLQMDRPGIYQLPAWHGSFIVTAATELGVAPARLRRVQVRPRAGGERFRFAPRAAARSLKQQFQSRSIPTWQRTGPLLFDSEGQLVFVPGLGLDATVLALQGEPQCQVRWLPGEAGAE
jgi:tRNA(Ile)-lysidine synthase